MNRKKIDYFTSIYLVLSISQYYGSFFALIFYTDLRDYKQILLDGKCKFFLTIQHSKYVAYMEQIFGIENKEKFEQLY